MVHTGVCCFFFFFGVLSIAAGSRKSIPSFGVSLENSVSYGWKNCILHSVNHRIKQAVCEILI